MLFGEVEREAILYEEEFCAEQNTDMGDWDRRHRDAIFDILEPPDLKI